MKNKMLSHASILALMTLSLVLGACSSGRNRSATILTGTGTGAGAGTGSGTSTGTGPGTGTGYTAGIYCNATPGKSTVDHDELTTLTITASGGTAPYYIEGFASGFHSSTTLSGRYFNSTSYDIVTERTAIVRDSTGASTTCDFSVTVRSVNNPSRLGCEIVANPAAPEPGAQVTFQLVASGGEGSYQWGTFYAEPGRPVPLSSSSGQTVSAYTSYSQLGYRVAMARVRSGNHEASCYLPLTVRQLSLQLVAIPATAVNLGTPITLRAFGAGFAPEYVTQYSFTTTEPNIQIVPDTLAGTAVVRATDGLAHDFSVTVKAFTNNGETLERSIQLRFLSTLNCSMTVSQNPIIQSDIHLTVTASTGEPVQVVGLQAGPDGYPVSTSSNPAIVRFATPGTKWVNVNARSALTGAQCNNGQLLSQVVQVVNRLTSCDVTASPNPSVVGTPTRLDVTLPQNSGIGPFTMTYNTPAPVSLIVNNSALVRTLTFLDAGEARIDVTVTDTFDGTQVSCYTYHTSTVNSGLLAKVYPMTAAESNWGVDLRNFNPATRTPTQTFTAANINVPTRHWTYGFPGVIGLTEWFYVTFQGRLKTALAGSYKFKTVSDDGVRVWIDGQEIISNPTVHPTTANESSGMYLAPGYHDLVLWYDQGPRTEIALQLFWRGPASLSYEIVPASALSKPIP